VRGRRADRAPSVFPAGDIAVVSPHLDDAVFSLGSSIADLCAARRKVVVVTLFAGDRSSDAPPSPWDERCGFGSAAESARTRRAEDARACALLGVEPVWLSFDVRSPEGAAAALLDAVQHAAVVLVPGFPCTHRDHILAARTVLGARRPEVTVGLYVDQPYAMWLLLGREARGRTRGESMRDLVLRRDTSASMMVPDLSPHLTDLVPRPPVWLRVGRSRRAWLAKQRATLAYRSQRRAFSRAMPAGIALYERQSGGEGVAWL
jgi:LmbE family N-acetylglucosaminyl deacetylase